MSPACRPAEPSGMGTTYGVVWREGDQPLARGRLELLPRAVRLDGMAGSEPLTREIPYDHLSEIRIGRTAEERIDGRPSLMLAPRTGGTVSIASVAQTGALSEIAERLAALQLDTRRRRPIAFVLPLREDAHDAARELLQAGPPFDLELLDLDRHQVLLTASEAIFIFESKLGAAALEPLLRDPGAWLGAADWQELLAGPPRIAENFYSWTRPGAHADRSLLPPGLRDGDGF